jgi:O-antigen ligase
MGQDPSWLAWNIDGLLFGLALCAVTMSIAVTESLLAGALVFRIIAIARGRARVDLPRAFWFWLAWAILELVAWLFSPQPRLGEGEMRHLVLAGALFLLAPTLNRASNWVAVWRGIAVTASISSLVLIGHFAWQLLFYHGTLDPVVYLRSGGLLHHWMVYGTVEILVFAGLLELWDLFPCERRWLLPVFAINAVAILVSLTRMLWVCSAAMLCVHLVWRRSRWLWAIPAVACIAFWIAPGAVRDRVTESMRGDYYPNAERIQMLRVGWKMIRNHPLTGVGPGHVEELYTKYLSASDPIPAFHGHLHNNLVQLAAEFGVPVTMAAVLFVATLFRELRSAWLRPADRGQKFLCRTAILGLSGFIVSGLFDYTYGHSLAIILLCSMVLAPLVRTTKAPNQRSWPTSGGPLKQALPSTVPLSRMLERP